MQSQPRHGLAFLVLAGVVLAGAGNVVLPPFNGPNQGNIDVDAGSGLPEIPIFTVDLNKHNALIGTGVMAPGVAAQQAGGVIGIGPQALASVTNGGSDVAVGYKALNGITREGGNTAVGASALAATPSSGPDSVDNVNNTAVGYSALAANRFAEDVTAVGYDALASVGTAVSAPGGDNTAFGYQALAGDYTGPNNTAFGQSALQRSLGSSNVAVGYDAMYSNTQGNNNDAVGYEGLYANTTGSSNSALGWGSLASCTTGSNNIGIGYLSGLWLTTGSNDIYIATFGALGESNTIRIGNPRSAGSHFQTATFIPSILVGPSSGQPVLVNSAGQLGTTTSSERFKQDIRDMGVESQVLMSLRPVRFKYRPEYDPEGRQQYGLIAEEVAEKSPELVAYGEDGVPSGVRYNLVNAMMLNELQRLRRERDARQVVIDRLGIEHRQSTDLQKALVSRLEALERRTQR